MSGPAEKILNDAHSLVSKFGSNATDGATMAAMRAPASSGLGVIVDYVARTVQLSLTMGLVLALAGMLCLGLTMSARQFTRTAKSTRQAVQIPTIKSMSERLRSAARDPQTANERERFLREIEAVSRQLDVQKLTALRGELQELLNRYGRTVINERPTETAPPIVESPVSPLVPPRR